MDTQMTENESTQQTVFMIMDQGFYLAVIQHKAGNLKDAEGLYRAILQVDPAHVEANHNLGVLMAQMDQPVLALPYLLAALDADATCGQYWLSYIDALSQSGQKDEAKQILAQAMNQGLEGEAVDLLASRLASVEDNSPTSQGVADVSGSVQSKTGKSKAAARKQKIPVV